MKSKEITIKILNVLFDSEANCIINNIKCDNCKITEIDTKENKVYFRHDYLQSVKYLIKGETGCYLNIDGIKGLEIDIEENICRIVYE